MSKKVEFAPTPSNLKVLKGLRAAQINASPLQPTIREIAAFAGIHYSRVSRVLRLMEKKGWLEIKPTGGNGRPKIVFKVKFW